MQQHQLRSALPLAVGRHCDRESDRERISAAPTKPDFGYSRRGLYLLISACVERGRACAVAVAGVVVSGTLLQTRWLLSQDSIQALSRTPSAIAGVTIDTTSAEGLLVIPRPQSLRQPHNTPHLQTLRL
jgi:hypothetical protein